MDWLFDLHNWTALITLTALEIILGIDNIVVISILSGRLPSHRQQQSRTLGLSLALITRIMLLLSLSWLISLTQPLFTIWRNSISPRDVILISGGLFLLAKGTREIHHTMNFMEESRELGRTTANFGSVIIQILLLDLVFSLDSVITAIGMAQKIGIMVAAIIIAVIVMLLGVGLISNFIHRHPSIKMLALSFLLMIGVTLIAEGLELHIPKGYLYFAMGFSGLVEILNIVVGHRKVAVAQSLTTRE
ncbi:MAG: TerC family protein [Syntrophobacterales bacterium]|nr:TerC family protein [Syntrophobacterales bacterium]